VPKLDEWPQCVNLDLGKFCRAKWTGNLLDVLGKIVPGYPVACHLADGLGTER